MYFLLRSRALIDHQILGGDDLLPVFGQQAGGNDDGVVDADYEEVKDN